MNDRELAQLMLDYEEAQQRADAMAHQIRLAILKRCKSLTVGNVVTRYNKGRTTKDYQQGVIDHERELRETFDHDGQEALLHVKELHVKTSYDWRAICSELGIEAPVKKTGEPSVSIKIKE